MLLPNSTILTVPSINLMPMEQRSLNSTVAESGAS